MSPITLSKEHECAHCQKGFRTEIAKNQHAQMKHPPEATQKMTIASEPTSSAATLSLTYRNIAYTTLSAAELNAIRLRLSELCHSEERLRKEGYSLPTGTGIQNDHNQKSRADLPCPDTNPSAPKTAAIVLDCEMGGTFKGENELIQMTMIDFLSGKVLQSCLVNPSRPIINWREDITGISAVSMQEAVAENKVLHGWEAARAELWRFADRETILIGQSVCNDLKVLHASHSRIIDSAIVTAEAVLGKDLKIRKRWGLKTLCDELLGIQIRKPSQTGGCGVHDALEDALATREVVLLCAREPDKLRHWANVARKAFFKKKIRGSKQTRHRPRSRPPARLPQGSLRWEDVVDWENIWPKSPPNWDYEFRDEYDETLRWEDVVDWEIWPKSPPDWD